MNKKEKKVWQPFLPGWNKKKAEHTSNEDAQEILPDSVVERLNNHQKRVSESINQALNTQAENKEKKLYLFRPGTPIYVENKRGLVYAEKEFVAERIKGKITGYSAFKLVANTLVYRQRGWEKKRYFYLRAEVRVGLSNSSQDYRPKELKQTP
jgi:hypothetical protein